MAGFYVWDNQETALSEFAEHYATLRDGRKADLNRVVIGLPDSHGIGGGSGFESHSKEHDLLLRIGFGQRFRW